MKFYNTINVIQIKKIKKKKPIKGTYNLISEINLSYIKQDYDIM